MTDLFANRVAVLATMHHKEKVIAPLLEPATGMKIRVPTGFDSDRFGTFTRDRNRPGTQIETARYKAQQVLELTGETLALASEGSFLPHPLWPALATNREVVLLLDRANNLEVIGQAVSSETNYSHKTIGSLEEAQEFARRVGFPDHGLVVMPQADCRDETEIIKGITTVADLEAAIAGTLKQSATGTIHIETDMRALYNPTRMTVIEKATLDLLTTLQRRCPECQCPGFALREYRPGLPCALCQLPTPLSQSAIYHCQRCGGQQEVLFPDGRQTADPAQCAYCNP